MSGWVGLGLGLWDAPGFGRGHEGCRARGGGGTHLPLYNALLTRNVTGLCASPQPLCRLSQTACARRSFWNRPSSNAWLVFVSCASSAWALALSAPALRGLARARRSPTLPNNRRNSRKHRWRGGPSLMLPKKSNGPGSEAGSGSGAGGGVNMVVAPSGT